MVEFDDRKKLTDAELLAVYEETSGNPDDPVAAALAAEIEWRNLDV